MQKAAWTIVIVMLGAVGGFLVAADGDYASMGRRRERHLELIGQQLSSLKVHLRKFKEVQGRYPSADEGLGVLDNFASRMKVVMFRLPPEYRTSDLYSFESDRYPEAPPGFWHMVREKVQDYHIELGHIPRTLAQMEDAGVGWGISLQATADEGRATLIAGKKLETVERELAIGHDDTVFLIGPVGVLTPWQMPYVYENRREAEAAAFVDSPADGLRAERYSVKIDDGIYVWSVEAKEYADECHELWLMDVMIRCGGAGLIVLALVLIWRKMRCQRRKPVVAGLMISALVGAVSTGGQQTMCYVSTPMFSNRDPAMVSRRMELLDKYRAAGAISDKTYDKSLESMGRKPAEPPTTRPDEGE